MQANRASSAGLMSLLVAGIATAGLMSIGITSEVPIGSIKGTLLMAENKKPLPNADIVLERSSQDLYEGDPVFTRRTDEKGQFELTGLPAGSYVLRAYGKVHSVDRAALVIEEGKTFTTQFLAKRSDPYLNSNAGSRVFSPGEKLSIRTEGLVDGSNLTYKLLRIKPEEIEKTRSLADLLYAIASNRNRANPAEYPTEQVFERTVNLGAKDIEGVFVQEDQLDSPAEGTYLLRVSQGQLQDYVWLTVTKIALVTKTAGGAGVGYVCDLNTGDPVAGADVQLVTVDGKRPMGKSGPDGTLPLTNVRQSTSGQVLVSAQVGESRAYTWFYAGAGDSSNPYVGHFVTDRTVYRPGDTVRFKETFRKRDPKGYSMPPAAAAHITVNDPDGTQFYQADVAVDEWGALDGSVEIPKLGAVGEYEVAIHYQDRDTFEYFTVSEYRKPQFKVAVTPEKERYVRGDIVRFKIECTSFTGEPVPGAKVDASLDRGYAWFGSPFSDEYDEYADDSEFYGEYVRSFDLRTDENGIAWVEFDPSKISKSEDEYTEFSDAEFQVRAAVEDEGGRYFEGTGKVTVQQGLVAVQADFASYVAEENKDVRLDIQAADPGTGKPVQTELTIDFYREVWGTRNSGRFDVGRRKVRTDATGKASVNLFTQKGGSYVAKVTGRDERGNQIGYEAYLWVSSDEVDPGYAAGYKLLLDKPHYKPGETAQGLLMAPEAGGSALVSVEGENIYEFFTMPLKAGENKFDINADVEYAPNVTVSVVVIKGKKFQSTSRTMRVGLDARTLTVTAKADKPNLHPGETANFTVSTTDFKGQPVPADVSLAVVDEGIFQIKEDRSSPIETFYPRRWSEVTTSFSFPEIYLDGEDKDEVNPDVRRDFKDTAAWVPSVRTNDAGVAKVAVKLPDNLTSWRATFTALSQDTLVGKGRADVVAEKELMARLSLPQYLTQDDKQTATAWLVNATGQAMSVKVRAEAFGADLGGQLEQTIDVPANGQASVTWPISSDTAGEATIRVTADGGAFRDGLEQKLEIQPRAVWKEDSFSAVITPGRPVNYGVNVSSDAIQGELTVSIAGNRFGVLEESLDSLVEYPYGCVEQTMSRFVPAVLVRDLMRRSGISRPELDKKIDEVTAIGIARISDLEASGGGWGWFSHDEPLPEMTALVLDGFWRARSAGVGVRPDLIDRGLQAADKMLTAPVDPKSTWEHPGLVELATAVLRYGPSKSAVAAIQKWGHGLDGDSRSVVAYDLAYRTTLDPRFKAERDRSFRLVLRQSVSGKGTIANYSDMDQAWFVEACLIAEPTGQRADAAVENLVQRRQGRSWENTWIASQAIKAVCLYLQSRPDPAASGTATVTVAGKVVWTGNIAPKAQPVEVKVPLTSLKSGRQDVSVSFEGTGKPLGSWNLREAVPPPTAPPASPSGLAVKREYFKMETVRLEDGTLRRVLAKSPATTFQAGEVYRVRLTLKAPAMLRYLCIEDPVPSNARIIDSEDPSFGSEWTYWWAQSSFYDDKAVFFDSWADKGEHVLEYAVRAEAPGECIALPTRAYLMYQKGVEASSAPITLRVQK